MRGLTFFSVQGEDTAVGEQKRHALGHAKRKNGYEGDKELDPLQAHPLLCTRASPYHSGSQNLQCTWFSTVGSKQGRSENTLG